MFYVLLYVTLWPLLYARSSIAIILMGKRELVALLNLSSWCLVMVERLFLAVPWGCLRFVIVVFPDHTLYYFGVECCNCPTFLRYSYLGSSKFQPLSYPACVPMSHEIRKDRVKGNNLSPTVHLNLDLCLYSK